MSRSLTVACVALVATSCQAQDLSLAYSSDGASYALVSHPVGPERIAYGSVQWSPVAVAGSREDGWTGAGVGLRARWIDAPSGLTLSVQGSLLQGVGGSRAVLAFGVGWSWPSR